MGSEGSRGGGLDIGQARRRVEGRGRREERGEGNARRAEGSHRDSLRLEAGLCLYGHDIDMTTTPVEAALKWAIQKVRRTGGERAGGFPGAQIILAQFENGTDRVRVGLAPEGRAPVREGADLFADETAAEPFGKVTSGGFGPSYGGPVSMGYVPSAQGEPGTIVYAEVRGKRMPLRVAALPFVQNTYKR